MCMTQKKIKLYFGNRPACKLVIIFDMFRSHTGYVQSRGRARHLTGSEYIVMIRKNDLSTLDSLSKAKMAGKKISFLFS